MDPVFSQVAIELLDTQVCSGSVKRGSDRGSDFLEFTMRAAAIELFAVNANKKCMLPSRCIFHWLSYSTKR